MNEIEDLRTAVGKREPRVIPETIEAMKRDRLGGMSIQVIADKYHVAYNTAKKYLGDAIVPSEKLEIKKEGEIQEKVMGEVLSTHGQRILASAKEKDAGIIHAGRAIEETLKDRGIDIDLSRVPPDQIVRLIRGGYEEMNPELKATFQEWLKTQLSKGDSSPEKPGKISFEDVKEILMLNFLMKMANQGDSPQNNSQVEKLIVENEKMRQDFRAELEKNRQEMKDLVLEKRFQTMDETHAETVSSLSGHLNAIVEKIEGLKTSLPVGDSPAQKTALDELGDAVAQINKIKGSLTSLGVVSAAPGSATQSPDIYKNTDGSTDYVRFIGDKIESSVKAIAEAHSKKTPEQGTFVETPPPETQAQKFAEYLLSKPDLSPDEQQWLALYRENLVKQQTPQADQVYVQLIRKTNLTPDEMTFVKNYEAQVYKTLKNKPKLTLNEINFLRRYEAFDKPQEIPSASEQMPAQQPLVTEPPVSETMVEKTPEVVSSPIEAERPAEPQSILDKLKADEEQRNKALEGLI